VAVMVPHEVLTTDRPRLRNELGRLHGTGAGRFQLFRQCSGGEVGHGRCHR
jgi:hypothetical protein